MTSDRKSTYSADYVQACICDALRNTAGVTSSQTSPTVYNNISIRGIAVDNRANYRLNGSLPMGASYSRLMGGHTLLFRLNGNNIRILEMLMEHHG